MTKECARSISGQAIHRPVRRIGGNIAPVTLVPRFTGSVRARIVAAPVGGRPEDT